MIQTNSYYLFKIDLIDKMHKNQNKIDEKK